MPSHFIACLPIYAIGLIDACAEVPLNMASTAFEAMDDLELLCLEGWPAALLTGRRRRSKHQGLLSMSSSARPSMLLSGDLWQGYMPNLGYWKIVQESEEITNIWIDTILKVSQTSQKIQFTFEVQLGSIRIYNILSLL